MNNIGSLFGLVLTQLRREGTPFIREGGPAGTMDQRYLVGCYGRPEGRGFQANLGQLYNLPTFGLAGGSDAKGSDAQAVAEISLSLAFEALSGNSLIHGIGALEGGKAAALELLVIGNEIIGWLQHAVQGMAISPETLALDVVEAVGHDNLYLSTEHSARHCRDDWQPTIFDYQGYDAWQAAGAKDLLARARDRVNNIVRGAAGARALPQRVVAKMNSIVSEADRQAGRRN